MALMNPDAVTKRKWVVVNTIMVVGLTMASGVVQGRLAHRWGTPIDMSTIAEQLKSTPDEFGHWRLRSSDTMNKTVLETLQCKGYFVREYANRETGRSVNVALILGPSGPISVHTPEVCYSSQDFEIEEKRQAVTIGGDQDANDVLWAITFRSNDAIRGAEMLRVYYGWSTGGAWSATREPRLAFAGQPYLYKLQLAARLPAQADMAKEDVCRDFLSEFLPILRSHLVSVSTN
jgi:hypothetical protein